MKKKLIKNSYADAREPFTNIYQKITRKFCNLSSVNNTRLPTTGIFCYSFVSHLNVCFKLYVSWILIQKDIFFCSKIYRILKMLWKIIVYLLLEKTNKIYLIYSRIAFILNIFMWLSFSMEYSTFSLSFSLL